MDGQRQTVEDYLGEAVSFMQRQSVEAVLVQGVLDDGRAYEGISFMGRTGEIGEVRFADGKLVNADAGEVERRLGVTGFIGKVIRPVQRAAAMVYGEESDLLDERFDVLGMS